MIIQEGVKVRIGGDNRELVRALRGASAEAMIMKGAVGAALAAVAAGSVRMAAQLDRDLRLVATLGGEAAGSVGTLRREIQQLGRDFGRDFGQLTRANYQAVSAGFKSIAQSMQVTRAGTRLAIAGNADLIQSTEAVAKWMKAFSGEALDAEKSAAQLWGTTRDGIVTVEQLGRFLSDLPATMSQSGIKSHELVAALSTLTGVTGNASRAVDQLRSLVVKMEVEGFSGSLLERIENFANKGLGELVTLLGDQTAATGAQVLAANMGTLSANIASAQKVTDDFTAAVDTMSSGALSEWEQLQQNINSMMQELGAVFLPAVNAGLRTMNSMLNPQATKDKDFLAWANREAFFTGGGPRDLSMLGPVGAYIASNPPMNSAALYARAMSALVPATTPAGLRSPFMGIEDPYGIAVDPFAAPGAYQAELMMHAYRAYGAAPSPSRVTPTNYTAAGLFGFTDPSSIMPQDFITSLGQMGDEFKEIDGVSRTTAAAAGILSSTVGGLLTSAFVTADSAAGRFIQGLLAQFAQLGIQTFFGSVFKLPGFATGGFTGSTGGVVHPNEFVFNADAVRSIGLGALERQQAIAMGGGPSVTINQTVNGGNPNEVGRMTHHAVERALRESASTGAARLYKPSAQKWR